MKSKLENIGNMVDIVQYRMRIGTFSMPAKHKSVFRCLRLSGRVASVCLRLVLMMTMLLVSSGDVELNPGPPKQTRQRQLSFAQALTSPASDSSSRTPSVETRQRQHQRPGENNDEVLSFLRDMKKDMRTDFDSINTKIDVINTSINELKSENEELKKDNQDLRVEIETLKSNFDRSEAQSRRNNLRFKGVKGPANEDWGVTEGKVRTFIKQDLGLPELESVEIERAHRVGANGRDDCPIIVKFLKYKDREQILRKSRETLNKTSPQSVHEDFTTRVLHHRRELGVRMMEARREGKYASVSYDKLIIEDDVYKYDERSEKPVLIGRARGRPAARFHARQNNQSRDREIHNQAINPVNGQDNETLA